MSCPKNIITKKYWFFGWKEKKVEGAHDWRITRINHYSSSTKIIYYKCPKCECGRAEWVDAEDVVRMLGFMPKVTSWSVFEDDSFSSDIVEQAERLAKKDDTINLDYIYKILMT